MTLTAKHFSELESYVLKLKNNFVISQFVVSAEIDFLYAIVDEDNALLLNVETFGTFSMKDIAETAKTMKVALVDEANMQMFIYNVAEDVIIKAAMEQ